MSNHINYKWASLGTGVIANELAQALEALGGKLYSVANRTYDKGLAFAEKYGIEKVYHEIDEVFEDPEVDIIYISTPHNTHIQCLRKALAAGKHVLCEKSITLNSEELAEAIKLAEENHVKLAEAMTIFHMPIYRKLSEIVASGKLGPLKVIQMNFGSYKEYDMSNRFLPTRVFVEFDIALVISDRPTFRLFGVKTQGHRRHFPFTIRKENTRLLINTSRCQLDL